MTETGSKGAEGGIKQEEKQKRPWLGEEAVEIMIYREKNTPYICIFMIFKVILQDYFSFASHYYSMKYEI